MERIADISRFEALSQMTNPVINSRLVVDNGFRDVLHQKAQARQDALDKKF